MRRPTIIALAALGFALASIGQPNAQKPASGAQMKALVGGTLIDGFGGRPVRNSVVLIEGERISAVGVVGSLAVPAGAEGH